MVDEIIPGDTVSVQGKVVGSSGEYFDVEFLNGYRATFKRDRLTVDRYAPRNYKVGMKLRKRDNIWDEFKEIEVIAKTIDDTFILRFTVRDENGVPTPWRKEPAYRQYTKEHTAQEIANEFDILG